jgi:hypothetical protein
MMRRGYSRDRSPNAGIIFPTAGGREIRLRRITRHVAHPPDGPD